MKTDLNIRTDLDIKKGSHALRRLPFYIYLSVINYSASQFPLAKRL